MSHSGAPVHLRFASCLILQKKIREVFTEHARAGQLAESKINDASFDGSEKTQNPKPKKP